MWHNNQACVGSHNGKKFGNLKSSPFDLDTFKKILAPEMLLCYMEFVVGTAFKT